MKFITVTIDTDGNADVNLEGYNGKGCQAVVEGFNKAIGSKVEVKNKPEFNKPCITTNRLQNRS
jgi:Protein of unknown function (DUF2997)